MPTADEREYLLPDIAARPSVGRITGRGNTAKLESVLALKSDLILDVGATTDTYVSFADHVQSQTGIPYGLLDGTLARMPETYRLLGRLLGREQDAEILAIYSQGLIARVTGRVASVRQTVVLASTSREGRVAWRPRRVARSMSRAWILWAPSTSRAVAWAGSRPSRSSRCSAGSPTSC